MVEYECVLIFDLLLVGCNIVGLLNLYCCVVIKDFDKVGIIGIVENEEGLMLDGVCIIVVIISCINISNLCNVIVVGLFVCNVNVKGLICKLWVKILLVLGFKVVKFYLEEVNLLFEFE